jgi:hypothetical protein
MLRVEIYVAFTIEIIFQHKKTMGIDRSMITHSFQMNFDKFSYELPSLTLIYFKLELVQNTCDEYTENIYCRYIVVYKVNNKIVNNRS